MVVHSVVKIYKIKLNYHFEIWSLAPNISNPLSPSEERFLSFREETFMPNKNILFFSFYS